MKCNFCSWKPTHTGPDGKADKWVCTVCDSECEKDDLKMGTGVRAGSWVKNRRNQAA